MGVGSGVEGGCEVGGMTGVQVGGNVGEGITVGVGGGVYPSGTDVGMPDTQETSKTQSAEKAQHFFTIPRSSSANDAHLLL
jgi:hypothetical protein